MRRRGAAIVTVFTVAAFVVACTDDKRPDGGGAGGAGSRPDPPPAVETLSATGTGPSVEVTWSPVDEAIGYELLAGDQGMVLPVELCQNGECAVSVDAARAPAGETLSIATIGEGDVRSEVTETDVGGSTEPAEHQVRDPDEVLLVEQGYPPRTEVVPVADRREAEQVLEEARENADGTTVREAGFNLPGRPHDTEGEPGEPFPTSSTTWQTQYMGFEELPGEPRGDGVRIAVLDSGVNGIHSSIGGALGPGISLGEEGADTYDAFGHGTGVASLIVGQPEGAVPGIAPGATVMPVKISDNEGHADLENAIEGITWAVDNGADIINISWGWACGGLGPIETCPEGFEAAVDYAEANGVVVVTSAGNNGPADRCPDEFPTNAPQWPAVVDRVISVGGITPWGDVFDCSPRRGDVDVLAPAMQLLVAQSGGGYEVVEGTSYAAPLISGLIAVILAEHPHLTPEDIRRMLPQWTWADGSINVVAVLATLGYYGDGPGDVDVLDVDWIYPYRATFSFGGDHPIATGLLPHANDTVLHGTHWGWARPAPHESQDGQVPFGEITGAIYGMNDGSLQATGRFDYTTTDEIWLGTAEDGSSHGHAEFCPWSAPDGFTPARVYGWPGPVRVGVEAVEVGADQAEIGLTFSPGLGATVERAGHMPPPTFVRNSMDLCRGAFDAYADQPLVDPFRGTPFSSYADAEGYLQEHFETNERMTGYFYDSAPMSVDGITLWSTGGQLITNNGPDPVQQDGDITVEIERWSAADG
ncbi:S8 family peptidase [Georgenia alba]|uniref:S8 family serine peptidase n=1 Tax=Georgenia alba TaxID=2233858 RepID=A0ABW2Q4S2_9MICO